MERRRYTIIVSVLLLALLVLHSTGHLMFTLVLVLLMAEKKHTNVMGYGIPMTKTYKLLYFYFFYTLLITLLNAEYLSDMFIVGIKRIILGVLALFVLSMVLRHINTFCFMKCYRIFIIILGIMGFIESILKYPIWESLIVHNITLSLNPQYRTMLFFYSPVINGVFWGIATIFCIMDSNIVRWKKLCLIALCIFNLILTRSRSSIIGVAVILMMIFSFNIFNKQRKKKKIKVNDILSFASIIFVLILLLIKYSTVIGNILTELYYSFINMFDVGDAGGKIVRLETFDTSIQYIRNNFIASVSGRGAYASQIYLKYNPVMKGSWAWTNGIDNQFLTLIYESGFLGLFLFFFISVRQIKFIWKARDRVSLMYGLMIIFFWITSYFYESLIFTHSFILYLIIIVLLENHTKSIKSVFSMEKSDLQ